MGFHREDGALPWRLTDAGRMYLQRYTATRREQWRAAGRCVDCGGERKYPTVRCELCLIGNTMRNARWQFKKRMAKVETLRHG